MQTMIAVLPLKRFTAKTVSTLSVSSTPTTSIRKSVYDLSADEISQLRLAFKKVTSINDNRGYQYIAGIHGYPQQYCHRIDQLFAVWHRPFILMFEQALQAQVPGVTLPYWDWTSDRTKAEGMPAIFTDATWRDPESNQDEPNPLLKQPILPAGTPPQFNETSRDEGQTSSLTTLRNLVQRAQRDMDYLSYTAGLENPHNGLHGWVGGTMGLIPWAAFDPIFWAHHSNVERLFCEWQDANPSVQPPDNIGSSVLAPFNVTVLEIWNYSKLGYAYAPPQTTLLTLEGGDALMAPTVLSGKAVANFSLAAVPQDLRKAELHFHEVKPPEGSFELRVFLNEPDANADTPIEGNSHYAGSYFFFGHGACIGDDHTHCEITEPGTFPVRGPHHLTPIHVSVDVSDSIRSMISTSDHVVVTLVAVDNKGRQIPNPGLTFEALRLTTE